MQNKVTKFLFIICALISGMTWAQTSSDADEALKDLSDDSAGIPLMKPVDTNAPVAPPSKPAEPPVNSASTTSVSPAPAEEVKTPAPETSASSPTTNENTLNAINEPKAAPSVDTNNSAGAVPDIAAINDSTDSPTNPTPPQPVSPPAQISMTVEEDLNEDVKKLEERFKNEVEKTVSMTPADAENQLEDSDPLELFSKIPIRPQMSDQAWKKWAGPALEKIYKVRKKDSLWAISERLFGTPYLWPKVWNLNAMFLNPHVISPNIEMKFTPGNPNSAPYLALVKKPGETEEEMPLLITEKEATLLDIIDFQLKLQNMGEEPPFKSFLLKDKPKEVYTFIPKIHAEGYYFEEGEDFEVTTEKIPDGKYSVVRYNNNFHSDLGIGNRLQWLGVAEASNSRVKIIKAFGDITFGDVLISEDFKLSPLAIYEESYDLKDKKPFARFVPLPMGTEYIAASDQLVGLEFPKANEGPRAGALITVNFDGKPKATMLLINRDETLGTGWIVKSEEEISIKKFGEM